MVPIQVPVPGVALEVAALVPAAELAVVLVAVEPAAVEVAAANNRTLPIEFRKQGVACRSRFGGGTHSFDAHSDTTETKGLRLKPTSSVPPRSSP